MRKTAIAIILSVIATTGGAVTISTEDPYPVRGEPTTVIVEDEGGPVGGVVVQVEYRPNSSTARTVTLPPTDPSGLADWTPEDAGLARLSASGPEGPEGTVAISIRFVRFEAAGIAIMLFAGLFLFGGAGYGMSLLLREQKAPEEEPPST